jgi:hypothetical protein
MCACLCASPWPFRWLPEDHDVPAVCRAVHCPVLPYLACPALLCLVPCPALCPALLCLVPCPALCPALLCLVPCPALCPALCRSYPALSSAALVYDFSRLTVRFGVVCQPTPGRCYTRRVVHCPCSDGMHTDTVACEQKLTSPQYRYTPSCCADGSLTR